MRLLLRLAATVALCQAARIPRDVVVEDQPHFPHFHAVHHGYGATSYQNVQIENYGSVPVPAEDEHRVHLAIHVQDEPHYEHHEPQPQYHEEIHEVSPIAIVPSDENHQHHQNFIIVQKDIHEPPPINEDERPIVEHPDEHQEYVILQQVPYQEHAIQHVELHEVPNQQYYGDNYHDGHEYEYH